VHATALNTLEELVLGAQEGQDNLMNAWQVLHPKIHKYNDHWLHKQALVVVENNNLRWEVMLHFHDHTLAGHPRIFKTYQLVTQDYWWPQMKKFIAQYVKGCAICQQTKSQTTKPKIPIYPITTNANTFPFETIALDLIVDLPPSQGYNSILTIMDHNCAKAAIFIPCCQTINAEGITCLYANHVFPHYGAPKKVISDRDTHFTAQFSLELCKALGIERNISMAYHPQTDGQSERTNQWLEQYLRIYSNYQQDDWARWLPLAQFVHNAWPSSTTGKTPLS
jgi:hypothetical protein